MPGPLAQPPPYPSHRSALLADRVVLVTAAAGTGIGYAVAQRCAEEGATVAISDRHQRRLGESAARLAEVSGTEPLAVVCDVTDQAQVDVMFDQVYDRHGRLDVLINNAGLGGTARLTEMGDDQWSIVLDVTLTATMRCTREALRRMPAHGGGVVVNNASILGWRAQEGQAHYAAAKAGVMALTRCAAVEGADDGIRVNAVSPSLALHPNLSKVMPEETLTDLVSREVFGRAAEPWEVANVMVFLASDLSGYMTGEVVSVSSQRA